MLIKEKVNKIRENSGNWRQRVQSFRKIDGDAIPSVSTIQHRLSASQEDWRKRVEKKDDPEFTVAGRTQRLGAPTVHRSFTIHTSDFSTDSLVLRSSSCKEENKYDLPHRPPAVPIVRATSKENRPESTSVIQEQSQQDAEEVASSPDVVKQMVTVHPIQDDNLSEFFNSAQQIKSGDVQDVQMPTNLNEPTERLQTNYHRIAEFRLAIRPERRKPQTSALLHCTGMRMDYQEIRPASAMQLPRKITPFQRLMNPTDHASRISREIADRQSHLADSAIAGLSSTENFSNVKSTLRQVTKIAPSFAQRQLLPYKDVMLLHVKGRRHVQVRLVYPSADSLNSGDCFIFVTPQAVYSWLGAFANVVEINKARELATWIHKHRELGFCGLEPITEGPIIVRENVSSTASVVKDRVNSETEQFWHALGYAGPQAVHACGAPNEDELYEMFIQHTNRIYNVTVDQLVPNMSFWGNPIRHSLLRSDQAFVFDFGSEVYLWTGTQVTSEIRLAGIELVNQAHTAAYDYSQYSLNPLDPLVTHSNVSTSGDSRPSWTLVGRVTERGETVLFKEKFVDWPEVTRIGIKCTPDLKKQRTESVGSAYSAIQALSADELYDAAFNQPAPSPSLLTLEGRFIGRGGEGCRYEDGIVRRYRVESGVLRVWHVSEFSRIEIPETSFGQFHQSDTYVIRWPFKVIHVGMRDLTSRSSECTKEQCAYFFWQGSQSKVTEKGAAALMTIELDEECCPQLRVPEGNEPPAFCHLFEGRMAIYSGKRGSKQNVQPRVRMFLVRGEVPLEGYLLEVPPRLSSLRPQGVFLVLQFVPNGLHLSVQKAWLWFGRTAPEASVQTARHVISRFQESCPPELASELRSVFEVQNTPDKLGPGDLVFHLNAEDHSLASLCLDVDRGDEPLVIWQLTLLLAQQLTARRLTYSLQPDASLNDRHDALSNIRMAATSTNPMDVAKAVAERIRASSDVMYAAQVKNTNVYLAFPFLLRDLYEAAQPAIFLVLSGLQRLYLWQGWWPLSSQPKLRRHSFTTQPHSPSSQSVLFSQSLFDNEDQMCVRAETVVVGGGDSLGKCSNESSVDTMITGSALSRFQALRLAAIRTTKALADKIGCRAVIVYAGLEPPEFLALFPPYVRDTEASLYYLREEGKVDGQMDSIESTLITSSTSGSYTLADLQQRPLPIELDATCLENYLEPEEFQRAFQMTKEEFEQMAPWKKWKLKKKLGLF